MVPAISPPCSSRSTGQPSAEADLVRSSLQDGIGRSPLPSHEKDMTAASSSPSQSTGQSPADADLVRSYLRDIGRVPLLSHEQEITLGRQVQDLMHLEALEAQLKQDTGVAPTWEEWAQAAELSPAQLQRRLRSGRRAKERMVSANLRLVVSVAKKYTKRNMELLDLIQEGTIGLVRGVEKFDPSRGYKFSTYAYWWIRQGITRAISEKSRAIRLPIHITEVLNRLKKSQRELSQQLGRTPTVVELSAAVALDEEQGGTVRELIVRLNRELGHAPTMAQLAQALKRSEDEVNTLTSEVKDIICRARQPVSLDLRVGDGDDTALQELLCHEGPAPNEVVDGECLKSDIEAILGQLPHLQCEVIKMRYGIGEHEPMSLTGIGRVLNMSRDRVRKLEKDCMASLRHLRANIEDYAMA